MTSNNIEQQTFHHGEQQLQKIVGVHEQMSALGKRVIRDHMPEQHRRFFQELPFVIVGSLDIQGQPSASLLAGDIESPNNQQLCINAQAMFSDPLKANIENGAPIALLGIELHSRRRNRLNGTITSNDAEGFTIDVDQSFGNCPKYIQSREVHIDNKQLQKPKKILRTHSLNTDMIAILKKADTFFIASASSQQQIGEDIKSSAYGADVSHRGGKPGFVTIENNNTLIFPDYSGNNFFCTLGNLMDNPSCGLLFIDFVSGDLLRVSGQADIIIDKHDPELRLVRINIERATLVKQAVAGNHEFLAYSPYNP